MATVLIKSQKRKTKECDDSSSQTISRKNPKIDDVHQLCMESELVGREMELKNIYSFVMEHMRKAQGGSIYLAGPPGTGKTAIVEHVTSQPIIRENATVISINCVGVKNIFYHIGSELGLNSSVIKNKRACAEEIEACARDTEKPIILILDEVDELRKKSTKSKQPLLYTIFEWTRVGQLLLIGIANTLDLTVTCLPLLETLGHKPLLLQFAPYTKQQLVAIIEDKLKRSGRSMASNSIRLLAAKIAAVSGDVRAALDVLERVDDKITNNAEERGAQCNTPPTATLGDIVNIMTDAYGAVAKLERRPLPLQQSLALCSFLLLIKSQPPTKSRNTPSKVVSAPNKSGYTIKQIYQVYRDVCCARNLSAVSSSEFISLWQLLESRNIVSMKGKLRTINTSLSLQWDASELSNYFSDKTLMSDILRGDYNKT